MEGRKKVREERQRGKRNKEEWKVESEGRNRGWKGYRKGFLEQRGKGAKEGREIEREGRK